MLRNIRASIRLILFFFISMGVVISIGIGNILLGIFSTRWKIVWKNKVIYCWAVIIAKIIGLKTTIVGTPPKPPFFIVANHLSYIDVLLFWQYIDATFIAKSDIKSWPFFGWATKTLGVLFINRDLKKDVPRMNERMASSITDEQGLILFPEGTSSKGAKVLPFKTPLLEYPASKNMPVHYVTISYVSEGSTSMNVCWWGDMPFFSHFWNLLKTRQFEATIVFGNTSLVDSDRKVLAQTLHDRIANNFIPVTQ